uniref:Uncharacterized protein n=2 Tax=Pseudo-nitzschia australis TaxID=44445 RepID=A0A7S4AIC9_9STRA
MRWCALICHHRVVAHRAEAFAESGSTTVSNKNRCDCVVVSFETNTNRKRTHSLVVCSVLLRRRQPFMLGFGTEPVSKPFWSVWQNTMDSRISMETQKVCQAASQTGRRRKGVRVLEPKIPSFLAKNLCVPTIHTQPGWTQLIINAKCLPQSLLVRLQNEDEAGVVLHPGQYEAFFLKGKTASTGCVLCATQRNVFPRATSSVP